jgi:beta-lactamase superfamily II metal-dependent hydrolase
MRLFLMLLVAMFIGACAAPRQKFQSAAHADERLITARRGASSESFDTIALSAAASTEELLLHVVDVGAGLCVVGVAPGGYSFLLDAGHWASTTCAQAVAAHLPDAGLSLVVISHNDSDHLGELPEIHAERAIDTLVWTARVPKKCRTNPAPKCPKTYLDFVRTVGDVASELGTVISLRETPIDKVSTFFLGDVEIQLVAGWSESPWEAELSDSEAANANSIVTRVVYGGRSVLVMGDSVGRHIGDPPEQCIAAEKWVVDHAAQHPIAADVLIASHHGADNGNATCLIEAVAPQHVIFSAGDDYGHPRQTTVDRFVAAGVPESAMLRTDRGSAVIDDKVTGAIDEWQDPFTARCGDRIGDDGVLIQIGRGGDLAVAYEQPNDTCGGLP